MEDAAVVEEHIQTDYSSIPRQIIGVCRHCNNTEIKNQEDADMLSSDLFENKFHLAKECDMLAFGFIS